jgi:integrase
VTVRELWERYSAFKRGNGRASTYRIIVMRLRDAVAHFGDVELMTLSVRAWCEYRDHRKIHGNSEGRALSTPTLNFELDWLRSMLNWAVGEEFIPHNPLQRAKREPWDSTRDTFLTEEDLQKILAVSSPVLRALVLVAFDTGLRKMEMLTLRWPQVDPRGFIALARAGTKTKRRRIVKLSARALEAVEALRGGRGIGWVFPSPYETPTGHYGDRHVSRLFQDACLKAGVQAAPGDVRVRWHDLRHSFATNAIRSGVPLQVVQRMTGHSTLAMLGRYLHAAEGDIDAAVAAMERARQAPQPAPGATAEGRAA